LNSRTSSSFASAAAAPAGSWFTCVDFDAVVSFVRGDRTRRLCDVDVSLTLLSLWLSPAVAPRRERGEADILFFVFFFVESLNSCWDKLIVDLKKNVNHIAFKFNA
jgi:hypothetical protein